MIKHPGGLSATQNPEPIVRPDNTRKSALDILPTTARGFSNKDVVALAALTAADAGLLKRQSFCRTIAGYPVFRYPFRLASI